MEAPRRVVVDSELLVLLLVGLVSKDLIARHKRLSAYTEEDFDFLARYLALVPEVVVTPNILTEASNLVRQIAEPMRSQVGEVFRQLLNGSVMYNLSETFVESQRAAGRDEFVRLGLTDSVLLEQAEQSAVLLTSDHTLCQFAASKGCEVLNFRYLRPL